MLAPGSQLAQIRPGVTTAVTAFSADQQGHEITRLVICNTTGSPVNASIFHDDDGTVYDQTTALEYATPIAANASLTLLARAEGGGIKISRGGALGVQSSTADALTFTLYGITEPARHA